MAQTVFNNFEIADMNLWRGEAYITFFDYLDHNGGFYYEVCLLTAALQLRTGQGSNRRLIFVRGQRWGDAPVHTIAASLFAGKDEIHFFREVGYEHYPFVHCPQGEMWERGRRSCEQERNFGTSRARGRPPWLGVAHLRFCTDYQMGWSCLPKWEEVKDIRHQQ